MKKKAIYQIINGKGENRRFDRRHLFLGLFTFIMVATFSFLYTSNMKAANAVDLSGFKAGNIMSDAVMRNYTSMTESEIQSFLNKKNSCGKKVSSVSGMKKASGKSFGISYQYTYSYSGTTYYYHVEDGKFVCLNNEKFDGETAAHIIYQAAQDYKINPQVLIVLLQKEQGLITDQWPNINHQYRSATGYGCPDNAPCNSEYYGFKNQVRKAAELFDIVLSGNSKYYPIGNNNIRWSPKASCGSSKVYIENYATSALYRYTPYQPNAAALRAGYGTGDGCSAYGNRNFYAYFTDWFGSTQKVQNYSVAQALEGLTEAQRKDKAYIFWANNVDSLGKITKQKYSFSKGNSYKIIETQNGAVFGNEENGYYGITKKAFDVWVKYYKELGPQTSRWINDSSTGIQRYNFKNGVIMNGDKNGWYTVVGKFKDIWVSQSSEKGALGYPTSDILETSGAEYKYQTFSGGAIAGTDKNGYYGMTTKAFDIWKENYKALGDQTARWSMDNKTGYQQYKFKNGVIFNHGEGWGLLAGKIRDFWVAQNSEKGALGYPVSDITEVKDTKYKYQVYEGGAILGSEEKGYYGVTTKAFEIWKEYYKELGLQTSRWLYDSKTGFQQYKYENGAIVNGGKGWFVSTGKIRDFWVSQNSEKGALGYPISDVLKFKNSDFSYQMYSGGAIFGTSKTGYYGITTVAFEIWKENSDELGAQTSRWLHDSKTGFQQYKYEKGIIANGGKGWFAIYGKIKDIWDENGANTGKYGIPIASKKNSCQKFKGGTICEE